MFTFRLSTFALLRCFSFILLSFLVALRDFSREPLNSKLALTSADSEPDALASLATADRPRLNLLSNITLYEYETLYHKSVRKSQRCIMDATSIGLIIESKHRPSHGSEFSG